MPHSFKLSRRIARFRAPLLILTSVALAACDSTEPQSSTIPEVADRPPADSVATTADDTSIVAAPPLASVSFAGGIPIGMGAQPNSAFGSVYNGAVRPIQPDGLLSNLASIKSKGGRIFLMMAGNQYYYKNADGTFSLSKWKARVDRYRNTNFASYVKDGTVIAHYLIDEPYDPTNWGGKPIPGSTLDAMAKYSKQIWPSLLTVVRAEPYRIQWSGTYQYLDAAWAQFYNPRGTLDPNDYLKQSVADAQRMGLGLVVGLNLLGGAPPLIGPGKGGSPMSVSQVKNWGSAMLNSSYPCAFVSYTYDTDYLSRSGMTDAMKYLRSKAQNRAAKSCRVG
jgi:hypothetical protein